MSQEKSNIEPGIFQNKFLDLLTRTSPSLVLGVFGTISLGTLIWDFIYNHQNIFLTIGLFAGGALTWSFAEYFLHRYLFHMFEHSNSKILKSAHFALHGYHHSHPKDTKRLFMPLPMSLTLGAGFLGLWYLILGEYAFSFWPGFVMGYVGYSLIHYYMHAKELKGSYWKKMTRHHSLHHFKYNEKAFGISSPLWDYVFMTMPPKESRKSRANRVVKQSS